MLPGSCKRFRPAGWSSKSAAAGPALAVAAGQNPAHRFAGIDWSDTAWAARAGHHGAARRVAGRPPVADGTADVLIMRE